MAARILRIRLPLVFVAIIGMVASGDATLGTGKDLDPNSSADWLGVIAGDEAGSEIELAAEMAELFANDSPLPRRSGTGRQRPQQHFTTFA